MTQDPLQTVLADGLARMGLVIAEERQVQLMAYLRLIDKWNKVHNLTAVRDPREMVTVHLLDSLSVLPHIQTLAPQSLLDVGAGAGLPSIPLAICLPELQVTAIDAVQKKASFMRQVKGELGLTHFSVEAGRVEALHKQGKFDVIVSRAFSEIALFVRLSKHLLAEGGHWLAMKGLMPTQELVDLDAQVVKVVPLEVPGLNAERHLVFLQK